MIFTSILSVEEIGLRSFDSLNDSGECVNGIDECSGESIGELMGESMGELMGESMGELMGESIGRSMD
ncbi:MAG: hypothetical protein LIP12_11125 [Clostridiales bacterium]|nr:hypothetical protein [Clostridiales bacterium]